MSYIKRIFAIGRKSAVIRAFECFANLEKIVLRKGLRKAVVVVVVVVVVIAALVVVVVVVVVVAVVAVVVVVGPPR